MIPNPVPMRHKKLTPLLFLLFLTLMFLGQKQLVAQDDPAAELHHLINQVRLDTGLPPLAKSTLLQQAAQRHADDLAQIGIALHEGRDGSTYQQRIREAGYRAWNDGLMVNEALWMGLGGTSDAAKWFLSDPEAYALCLEHPYREIGIGFASDEQGVHYIVITFGARPAVLPIFVNDGNTTTESPQIAVRLTNEEAEAMGEGTWLGKAIEVRLSDTPDFTAASWQPWEPLLPWALPDTAPGDYAIYVEFRDGANRTTVAEAVIRLVAPGESPPTPTLLADLSLRRGIPSPTPEGVPSDEDALKEIAPLHSTRVPEHTADGTPVPEAPPPRHGRHCP